MTDPQAKDCPNCGTEMHWKFLKKDTCPCCDPQDTAMASELNSVKGRIRRDRQHLNVRFAELFPVGTQTTYQHGYERRPIEILGHAGDRVKVRGATGKAYYIDHIRIWTRAYPPQEQDDDS